MRVLLYDTSQYRPASPLFAEALPILALECGFKQAWFDESPFLKPLSTNYFDKVFLRLSGWRPRTFWSLNRAFLESARSFRPDLVLITKGTFLNPATLRSIKEDTGAILVNYATDDPFNRTVSTTWVRKSIPVYDFYGCTKTAIMDDVRKAGCSNPEYIPFAYKPEHHFIENAITAEEREQFSSDVVFIGGCDRDRVPIVDAILSAMPNLRLHLYGGFWDRYPAFRKYYRGFALGREYRLAIRGAKIVLNLVRRANRDGHVMRTFEVPACGGFMLADRTEEHLSILREDHEAVYFSSISEAVDKIQYYLQHDSEREFIAQEGHRRITGAGNTYRDRLKIILKMAARRSFNSRRLDTTFSTRELGS
jgi:spore maturation protein CgeB